MAPDDLHPQRTDHPMKPVLSLHEFCEATSLGRTRVFEEIKSGRLRPVRCGRRTLIPAEEFRAWLERLKAEGGAE